MLWLILFVVVIVAVVFAVLLAGLRPTRFEVSENSLCIRGSLFGRCIPAAELRIDAARVVDLNASPELRPKWRTMGIGLPGHVSGWMRLANREKALVFLTDRNDVVYIPTTAGYALLISPSDPQAFLSSLRTLRPAV
jgi:hypothetical protein